MPIRRRDFLGGLAGSGLLAAIPTSLAHAAEPDLTRPHALTGAPIDDTWDMSWAERLRGKSRAVFDSPAPDYGGAIFRAVLWREQHAKVFGTSAADLTPVVVVRHEAIPLIMDDEFWDHLGIGHDLKWKDDKTGKWYKRNPLASTASGAPDAMKKYTIPAFIADGGIVLACNLAFGEIIQQYADKDKVSQDEAKTRAKQHMIPGVILQPSGFFAVLKAQDEGCKYILGS